MLIPPLRLDIFLKPVVQRDFFPPGEGGALALGKEYRSTPVRQKPCAIKKLEQISLWLCSKGHFCNDVMGGTVPRSTFSQHIALFFVVAVQSH